MPLPNRHGSSESYDYGFNGMRKDNEVYNSEGTSYDFGARIYNPRIGRWLSRDAMASKYPDLSPYHFAGLNPIWFVELNGMVFDLGNLSPEQKEAFLKKADHYKTKSEFFNYYYSALEKSDQVYTIEMNDSPRGGGNYRPNSNVVTYKTAAEIGGTAFVQELFHAYQDDLGAYANDGTNGFGEDASLIEAEGDLASLYVQVESGSSFGLNLFTEWPDAILDAYGGMFEVPTAEDVNSCEYEKLFSEAVDKRIEYAKLNFPEATSYYSTPNSGKPPFAIQAVMNGVMEATENKSQREQWATETDQIGPRLENGDFYAE